MFILCLDENNFIFVAKDLIEVANVGNTHVFICCIPETLGHPTNIELFGSNVL